MKPSPLLLALVLLLPVSGCKNRQDLASRITGTWSADSQEKDSAAGELVLQKDGRFTANAIPSDLFEDSDIAGGHAISGTGTWSVRNGGDSDRVGLKFDNVQGLDAAHLPDEAQLSVEAAQGNVVLFFDPGDPDEDERVTFHKKTLLSRFTK